MQAACLRVPCSSRIGEGGGSEAEGGVFEGKGARYADKSESQLR